MDAPFEYPVVDLTPEEIAEEREVLGGLAESVRALAEASLRTTVDADVADDVRRQVDELTARLAERQIDGSFGVQLTRDGQVRGHGNAVVGLRNPIAPPLHIERSDEGRAWSGFELNALYEGPPGVVHGGVAALVLDQILGEAAAAGGSPGMTGTLRLHYRRPTPLGKCEVEGWIERRDGAKTVVRGELRRADGETTVEAEGIFIMPRWARELIEKHQERPPRFE